MHAAFYYVKLGGSYFLPPLELPEFPPLPPLVSRPASSLPATTAPVTAPAAAPVRAPSTTLTTASLARVRMPLLELLRDDEPLDDLDDPPEDLDDELPDLDDELP